MGSEMCIRDSGYLDLLDADGLDHELANNQLDLFRVQKSTARPLGSVPWWSGASDVPHAVPADGAWFDSGGRLTGQNGLPVARGKPSVHVVALLALLGWLVSGFFLGSEVNAIRRLRR